MPPRLAPFISAVRTPTIGCRRAGGRDERGLRRRLAVVVGGWLSNDSFCLTRCAWIRCPLLPEWGQGSEDLSRRLSSQVRAAAAFRGDDRRCLERDRLPLPRRALVAVGRGDDAGHGTPASSAAGESIYDGRRERRRSRRCGLIHSATKADGLMPQASALASRTAKSSPAASHVSRAARHVAVPVSELAFRHEQ